MAKRTTNHHNARLPKRSCTSGTRFRPIKVASADAAAVVDANPPLSQLFLAMNNGIKNVKKGDAVVYWMRMGDLRISDNRALSLASEQAREQGIPLVTIFALSPQDYIAHDRSPRRIDFTLRNLSQLKVSLDRLNIPLQVFSHTSRQTLPSRIVSLLTDLGSTSLYGNIEYEVDELRRDIKICDLAKIRGVKATFTHNKCIIEPGVILTKENKTYAVYSPYMRNWLSALNRNVDQYLKDWPKPSANPSSIRQSDKFSPFFKSEVPACVEGFELEAQDRKQMCEVWPEGEDTASHILQQFLSTNSRASQLGAVSPLAQGVASPANSSRILNYHKDRDHVDRDTTSRLSVYLSAGVLSVRGCIRETMSLLKSNQVEGGSSSGVGRWVQELAWRDFYTAVLAGFPRVSMGRPFLEKFSAVVWEDHQGSSNGPKDEDVTDCENLQRWKNGLTGVPIVDAGMRCMKEMGWVHNRIRMIVAMFLTKDLMIDWRVGERYFMETLIDGDLASNNGGWQWSASTGVDPCPYFRIFNPYSQSLKADPSGQFIRHWVPELRGLRGSDLHNPPTAIAKRVGYPIPIVKHSEARDRALRRYKNPGEQ